MLPRIVRLGLGVALLGYVAWALVPLGTSAWSGDLARARAQTADIEATSFEQRQARAYGDCGNLGYGYVSRVLERYPDARAIPRIAYYDWDRGVSLVLPRFPERVDERVIIGIDIDDNALREQPMALASRVSQKDDGTHETAEWAFRTVTNFDLLTRINLNFHAAPRPRDETIDLELYLTRRAKEPMARWQIPVAQGGPSTVSFVLPSPIPEFSIGRGATDFLIRTTRPSGGDAIDSLFTYAIKIDARGYRVIDRAGRCLTAVSPQILDEAARDPKGAWAAFVAGAPRAR